MPSRPIIIYPHPILKTACHPVTAANRGVESLITDLIDTMRAGPGAVGVAAPQIGVDLRVCVVDVSASKHGRVDNHGLLVLVNPTIVSLEGAATMREGCMSIPDYTGDVERAVAITVSFLDGGGTHHEIHARGFEAVAIQHEIDHLDGILFLDRISSLKTGLFRRKNYK